MLLKAAEQLGIEIPTLCYLKDFIPSSSCMVCVVEDKYSGKFLPACSALAQTGMIIETDNDEVKKLRKNAVELLLSEHVGDCEAPCKRACPAHTNIPAINRFLAKGDFKNAAKILHKTKHGCAECAAPCEKVCRRKNIDAAVSIMQLQEFIFSQKDFKEIPSSSKSQRIAKLKFNSSYGKMRDNEKPEFLKEPENANARTEPKEIQSGFTADEAVAEAKRCLHCDCRKADICKLRLLAEKFEACQRIFELTERNDVSKIIYPENVIYEPQKCIKCGICIQITEKTEEIAFTFIGRGFKVKIGVPFTDKISKALRKTAKECVDSCPTGALAFYKS